MNKKKHEVLQNRRKTGGKKLANGLDPSIGAATQFQPGVSGNAGGRPKRKPITDLYLKSLDEICLSDAQKRTWAEVIVANQLERARVGVDAVRAVREITDRTEGKARPSEEESEALQRVYILDIPARKVSE